ncbi:MAG TPA: peptidylprolyl isomerase [Thermoanaerobaculia bacterium]|nr:peptidylprolyl isomerase [Thermoanaerobaculia bacterium]
MTSTRLARPAVPILLALLAAASAPAVETIERILAYVNSRIITQSAFDARYEQAIREQGPPANAARVDELKKALFNTLINEALLEDRARDLDLITNDKEIEDQIRRLKEENKITTDAEFEKALESQGLTLEKLRDQLRNAGTVQRVVGREVQSKVDTSDDALRIIYEREKESYRIPEKARLAEILISRGDDPATTQQRVQAAVDMLRSGAKFEEAVKAYSDGSTKNRGGDLGWVSRGELLSEIDKTVFSLPVNTVSDPIATKFGWHLVKVLEKSPVAYKPFSEVKAEILKREQETQFQKKLAEYLEKLRRDAVIRVAPEAAAYYTPPAPAQDATFSALTPAAPGATPYDVPAVTPGKASRDFGIEITAMFGYRFGGTTSQLANSYIEKIGVPASMSWGATVEYRVSEKLNLELLWSHQDTELEAKFTAAGIGYDQKLSHLNIDTFQIGGMWLSGDRSNAARLYLDLLFGATLLTPSPEFSSVLRFSGSFGGGIKYAFADHFGARLGLRWMPVYINSKSAGYGTCSPYYGCYSYYGSNYLSQGDAYTGLTWKF